MTTRAIAAIALSTVLYAVAAPPWSADLFAPVILTPVLLALRGRSARGAFALGALFGVAASAGVTWWAPGMLARYFNVPLPIAVLGTGAMYGLCVALPFGCFATGSARLLDGGGFPMYVGVPSLWVTAEFARTHLFTGLPWEFLGDLLYRRRTLIQVADLTGVWGLSFLCVLSAVAVAGVVRQLEPPRGRALAAAALVLCLWGGTSLYGRWRLGQWDGPPVADVPVALVQGNRAPAQHVSPLTTALTLQTYLQTTRRGLGTTHPELIVWPENTASYFLAEDRSSLAVLRRLSAETGAALIVGGPRHDRATGEVHNAAYEIREDGIVGTYDKVRLVPFAEYPPLGLRALAGPAAVVTPGHSPGPILDRRGPLGVLICYEILYPELARRLVAQGANLLVNIANDTWFDPAGTAAAEQMTSMAVFRAVETRRWLARTTTTGESVVVDPAGRVQALLGVGAAAVLQARVALVQVTSPYVRLGDAFAWGCVLIALVAIIVTRTARPA